MQHVACQLGRAGALAVTRRRGRVGARCWAPRTREIVKYLVVCFVPGRARGGGGGGGWLGGAAGRCAEPLRERLLIFISQISRKPALLYKSKSGQGVANLP